MKNVGELRAFSAELGNDKPSPGGGTASAAAGAMAAGLLSKVCSITAKKKGSVSNQSLLDDLVVELNALREELATLAEEDAKAYDLVVEAARGNRETGGEGSEKLYSEAVKHAIEIPLKTAGACTRVLELSVQVAAVGTRRASSDIGVAVLLAEVGVKGAGMNVDINLKDMGDTQFTGSTQGRLRSLVRQARTHATDAMNRLR